MKVYQLKATLAAIALTALASACGGQAYREDGTSRLSSSTGGSSSTPVSTSPSPSPTPTETSPPYAFDNIMVTGTGGTNPTWPNTGDPAAVVETDNILRVKVIAKPGGTLSLSGGTYSNFSASYSCVQYTLKVGNQTWTTGLLNSGTATSGSPCENSPTSETKDFSTTALGSGHNSVSIQVIGVRYDFYCQMLYGGRFYDSYGYPITQGHYLFNSYKATYCTTYPVYRNHTVYGDIKVQVNGTTL